MSDQLIEWQTRLNTVGPISYPEQQALVAEAITWRANFHAANQSWRAEAREVEAQRAEMARLREGLDAAGDMLARVMEADAIEAQRRTCPGYLGGGADCRAEVNHAGPCWDQPENRVTK